MELAKEKKIVANMILKVLTTVFRKPLFQTNVKECFWSYFEICVSERGFRENFRLLPCALKLLHTPVKDSLVLSFVTFIYK